MSQRRLCVHMGDMSFIIAMVASPPVAAVGSVAAPYHVLSGLTLWKTWPSDFYFHYSQNSASGVILGTINPRSNFWAMRGPAELPILRKKKEQVRG